MRMHGAWLHAPQDAPQDAPHPARRRCGGMPDLLLWRVHGAAVRAAGAPFGEARLIEVKSPSDSLSQQQIAWIDLLLRSGVRPPCDLPPVYPPVCPPVCPLLPVAGDEHALL